MTVESPLIAMLFYISGAALLTIPAYLFARLIVGVVEGLFGRES